MDHLSRAWSLSFKIKPCQKRQLTDWLSIIHATAHNQNDQYGDSILGVWFKSNSSKLHVNMTKDYHFNTENELPRNEYSTVLIQQRQRNDSKFVIQLFINDKMLHEVVNNAAQPFQNVTVYAADPWHIPANAIVKELHWKNLGIQKILSENIGRIYRCSSIHIVNFIDGLDYVYLRLATFRKILLSSLDLLKRSPSHVIQATINLRYIILL